MKAPVAAGLLVVAVGLAARLGAAITLGDGFHFDDEAVYLDAAGRLTAGAGFGDGYRGVPAYPVVLAALQSVAPAGVLGVRLAQAVVTAAGGVLVLVLAGTLCGRRAALAAGLLYALDPLLVVSGALLYPEAVAAVLLSAVVLAVIHAAGRDHPGWAGMVGVALGALALLRPVTLVFVPVVAVWLAVMAAESGRRRVLHALLVVAGCGVALAPWTYRNYRVHGAVTPVARAGTHTAPVPRAAVQAHGLTGALLHEAVRHPRSFAAHIGREFLHFWEFYPQRLTTDNPMRRAEIHGRDPRLPVAPSFPPTLRDRVSAVASVAEIGLALFGLGILWRRRRADAVLLVALLLALGLGYAAFIGKIRYRIPVVPLLLVLAGAGLARLVRPRPPAQEMVPQAVGLRRR
jgi:4-amino-4-deoxy-L-arabinose transferase-like glycosyltransferase